MTYLPQRGIDTHEFGGEVKRKVDRPHYKEMYESAMSELKAQRTYNRLAVVLGVLGWIGFIMTVVISLIEKFK